MHRQSTFLRWGSWGLCLALSAGLLASPQLTEAAKPAKKATSSSRPSAQAEPVTAPAEAAPAPVGAGDARLAALVSSLRAALSASRQAGQEPDLTMALLSGIAEASLVNVVHGHYALAGVGQALRTGGMPSADVAVVAGDMQRNFEMLAAAFDRLARQKAFDRELTDIFRSLQVVTARADASAAALHAWAARSDDATRATAFETALEDYRGRVKAFVAGLGGR